MTTHRTQTSLITLATIGVYIGLLMAGATPCVLGQTPSATTRPFSVKDDLERKENLDKKPDEVGLNFAEAIAGYFEDVEELIEDLQRFNREQKFDFDSDRFEVERHFSRSCNEGYAAVISGGFLRKVENPRIESAITNSIYDFDDWDNFSDCLQVQEKPQIHRLHRFMLGVSYDESRLQLEISFSKKNVQQAELFAERLSHAYITFSTFEKGPIIKTLYDKTRIESTNDQVLIVTRLPRGSLHSLLATDAK